MSNSKLAATNRHPFDCVIFPDLSSNLNYPTCTYLPRIQSSGYALAGYAVAANVMIPLSKGTAIEAGIEVVQDRYFQKGQGGFALSGSGGGR
jgi:hypothetical protein